MSLTPYELFTLVQGDITGFSSNDAKDKKRAIVVPCNEYLYTGNGVSHSINETIRGLGGQTDFWENVTVEDPVSPYTAHHFGFSELPNVSSLILAVSDVEEVDSYDVATATTTSNVLAAARGSGVSSLAFPLYFTGETASTVGVVLPSMVSIFEGSSKAAEDAALDIKVYAYTGAAYDQIREIMASR